MGAPFPPLSERFERLEETVQIAPQMWSAVQREALPPAGTNGQAIAAQQTTPTDHDWGRW